MLRPTGASLPRPVWYGLITRSQREAFTRDRLQSYGIHAQYPVTTTRRRTRGKLTFTSRPVIPGLLFARFDAQPNWYVLHERRHITGVYGYGDTPTPIPYDVVRQVMGMPTTAEALRAAKEQLRQLRPGDKAVVLRGPLQGLTVSVTGLLDDVVHWETNQIKGTSLVNQLEKDDLPAYARS